MESFIEITYYQKNFKTEEGLLIHAAQAFDFGLPKWDAERQNEVCPKVPELVRSAASLGLNHNIIRSGIVVEIAFINAKEQYTVALRYKITPGANQKKVVIVVADDRD